MSYTTIPLLVTLLLVTLHFMILLRLLGKALYLVLFELVVRWVKCASRVGLTKTISEICFLGRETAEVRIPTRI